MIRQLVELFFYFLRISMLSINGSATTLTPEGIYPLLKSDEFFEQRGDKIIENVLVFLTILSLRLADRKDKGWSDEDGDYQEISTSLIIKVLARDNYKVILQRLEELNIIQVNRSYSTGQYCKGYRLSARYANRKLIARHIEYASVRNKIDALHEHFASKSLAKYPYLRQHYSNLQKIHIDYEGAMNWIEQNKDAVDAYGEKIIGNVENYKRQVLKIHHGFTRRMSVSESNHRMHSVMTSFPKHLRPFLGILDDEAEDIRFDKIVLDGCNTQPLLCCLKMQEEGTAPDTEFFDRCLDGTIYNLIASELGETKKFVKTRFMDTLLFTRGNGEFTLTMKNPNELNKDKQKFTRYFKQRFPKIFYWLLKEKRRLKESSTTDLTMNKNKRNAGGRSLSLVIQKMESDMWIHQLLKEKEFQNDLMYCTIHDAVMLFAPTDEQVKQIECKIKEVGLKMYGVDIPIKAEAV